MTANLRAGLIGLGMMGRHHARNLGALEGVDFVAACDSAGDVHGVAKGAALCATVEELLEHELDYCVIALPTELHEDVAIQLSEAGVNTLIEKPLAMTTEAAIRVAESFEKNGLLGAVGHIERFNPALQEMRARLANGELGDIYHVSTVRQGPFPTRIKDVGVVMDLASHDVDISSWVSGAPYVDVSARTTHRTGREHEDMVSVTATSAAGNLVTNQVDWLTPTKKRFTAVTGQRGMFVADTLTADLTFYANGTAEVAWGDISNIRGVTEGDIIRYAIAKPEPLKVEHENYRDALLGKENSIVTLKQGVAVIEVCEAILTSAAEHRTVALGGDSRESTSGAQQV